MTEPLSIELANTLEGGPKGVTDALDDRWGTDARPLRDAIRALFEAAIAGADPDQRAVAIVNEAPRGISLVWRAGEAPALDGELLFPGRDVGDQRPRRPRPGALAPLRGRALHPPVPGRRSAPPVLLGDLRDAGQGRAPAGTPQRASPRPSGLNRRRPTGEYVTPVGSTMIDSLVRPFARSRAHESDRGGLSPPMIDSGQGVLCPEGEDPGPLASWADVLVTTRPRRGRRRTRASRPLHRPEPWSP